MDDDTGNGGQLPGKKIERALIGQGHIDLAAAERGDLLAGRKIE